MDNDTKYAFYDCDVCNKRTMHSVASGSLNAVCDECKKESQICTIYIRKYLKSKRAIMILENLNDEYVNSYEGNDLWIEPDHVRNEHYIELSKNGEPVFNDTIKGYLNKSVIPE